MGPRQTYRICGHQQIASPAASTALTIPTAFNGREVKPNAVLMSASTQAIRWRADGGAPTSTVGHVLPNALTVGAPPLYYDGDLTALRFIQVTAGGLLDITYLEDESL